MVSFMHRFCCGRQPEATSSKQIHNSQSSLLRGHAAGNEAVGAMHGEAPEEGGPSLSSGPSGPSPPSESGGLQSKLMVPFSDLTFHALIGKGSFKQVYRGKWNNTNVAIVAMRRGGLVTEARLMQQLGAHPNLVQFYRWSTDRRGNEYVVVELVPFGSLDKVLAQFGTSLRNRSKLMMCEQICHAMCELAAEGVLHRDLAARNILVQSMQPVHVKVSDFGLARVFPHLEVERSEGGGGGPNSGLLLSGCSSSSTSCRRPGEGGAAAGREPPPPQQQQQQQQGEQQGEQQGQQPQHLPQQQGQGHGQGRREEEEAPLVPVRWSAPEVLRQGAGWSEKSDVYSYGITMWEIFSNGAEPYASRSDREAAAAIVGGDLLPRPKNCPHQVYSLMTDCWHPDPLQRPTFRQIANVYRRWREVTIAAKAAGGSGQPVNSTSGAGGAGGATAATNGAAAAVASGVLAGSPAAVPPSTRSVAASATATATAAAAEGLPQPSLLHDQYAQRQQQPNRQQLQPSPQQLQPSSGPRPNPGSHRQDPGGGYVSLTSLWQPTAQRGTIPAGAGAREGGAAPHLEVIPSGEVLRLLDHQVHIRHGVAPAAPPPPPTGADADVPAPYPALVSPTSSPSLKDAAAAAAGVPAAAASRLVHSSAPLSSLPYAGPCCRCSDRPNAVAFMTPRDVLMSEQLSRQPTNAGSCRLTHDSVSPGALGPCNGGGGGGSSLLREALRSLSATGESMCAAAAAAAVASGSGAGSSNVNGAVPAAVGTHACQCACAAGDGCSMAAAAPPSVGNGASSPSRALPPPPPPPCTHQEQRGMDCMTCRPGAERPTAAAATAQASSLVTSVSVPEPAQLMAPSPASTPRCRWESKGWSLGHADEAGSWGPGRRLLGTPGVGGIGGGSQGPIRSGPRRRSTFAAAVGGGGGGCGGGGGFTGRSSLSRPSPLRPVLSSAMQNVKRTHVRAHRATQDTEGGGGLALQQRTAASFAAIARSQDGAAGRVSSRGAGEQTPPTAGSSISASWLATADEAASAGVAADMTPVGGGGFLGLPTRYGLYYDPIAGSYGRRGRGWDEPSRQLRNALRWGSTDISSSSGPGGAVATAGGGGGAELASSLGGGGGGAGFCETCVLSMEVETAIEPMMSCSTAQSAAIHRAAAQATGPQVLMSPSRGQAPSSPALAATGGGAGGGGTWGNVASTAGGPRLLSAGSHGVALDTGLDSLGAAAGVAATQTGTATSGPAGLPVLTDTSASAAAVGAASAAVAATVGSFRDSTVGHAAPSSPPPELALAPIQQQQPSNPQQRHQQLLLGGPGHQMAPSFAPAPASGRKPAVHDPYLSIRMLGS